jgi:hypothetical protein
MWIQLLGLYAVRICSKLKLHGLSPRANYTDRATAACRRSDCQLLRIEGATWTDPYVRILGFLDRSRYFFYQVAPQLYSRGWVDPVADPLLFFFLVVPGNRTRASGSVAKNSDQLDHRGGREYIIITEISKLHFLQHWGLKCVVIVVFIEATFVFKLVSLKCNDRRRAR